MLQLFETEFKDMFMAFSGIATLIFEIFLYTFLLPCSDGQKILAPCKALSYYLPWPTNVFNTFCFKLKLVYSCNLESQLR